MKLYSSYIKRTIDLIVSGCGLICISPVFIAVAIWLHFANKGAGIFFLQERPGKNGKIFRVIKFKTMTDETDSAGNLLPNTQRLTHAGKIVRATSLDEIPQLINVLKGDMSLIGPRPLLTWFLPLYDNEQKHRHDVRPGITGWAQVNGRNAITYSEKFKLDLWYVNHLSFSTDMRILFMTVKNVLTRKNIGNGLQNEPDDLGWAEKKEWAEQEFERNFRN